MQSLWQDLQYAVRGMATQTGFAALVICCLGLGIGVNATLFSVVDGVLIQPFPYRESDRLVVVRMTRPASDAWSAGVSYPDLREWAEASRTLSDEAALTFRSLTLSDNGEPERYRGAAVTWNLFPMLGVPPALGRDFGPADDQPGAPHVVMLSDDLWQVRYQSDPSVIGRRIFVNGVPHEVVGIMPAGFRFPEQQQVWVPVVPLVHQDARDVRTLRPFARLAPGASLSQAQDEIRALTTQLAAAHPATNEGWVGQVRGLREEFIPRDVTIVLWLMMGAATLVLGIACSNAANLLLGRASGRRREMSVRAALGAGRGRIVRQLLTESAVFGACSVPLGLVIAWGGTQWLAASMPPENVPYYITWRIDWRSMAYALVVAVGTTVVFGLVPAFHATRGSLHDDLKEGARGNSGARSVTRDVLVVAQLALAAVSLVGAALFVRSFVNLEDYDVGFDPAPLVTLRVLYSGDEYAPDGAKAGATRDIVERMEQLPGVRGVFASNLIPLDGGGDEGALRIDGVPVEPGREPVVSFTGVTPGFVRTLGLAVEEGADFTGSQGWTQSDAALVNRTFATRFFPGRDAVGRRIQIVQGSRPTPWFTIAGVVSDVRHFINTDEVQAPAVYVAQAWQETPNTGFTIAVDGEPAAQAAALRREVRQVAPTVPIFAVRTMEELRRLSFWEFAIFGWVFGVIGVVALLLASFGVYGVTSHAVSQRTREIAVRMALGAEPQSIRRMVLRQSMRLAVVGVGLGLMLAVVATQQAESLLYGVTSTDPISYGVVAVFLLAVTAVAGDIPARRATRVHPTEALSAE